MLCISMSLLIKKENISRPQWLMPITSIPKKLRQEDYYKF